MGVEAPETFAPVAPIPPRLSGLLRAECTLFRTVSFVHWFSNVSLTWVEAAGAFRVIGRRVGIKRK